MPRALSTLPLPAVDDRLVMPGAGYEIIDGKVVRVAPSDPEHASRHSKVQAVLEAFVRSDRYEVFCDMLTRSGEVSDFAPDASVAPRGKDPATGGRKLERLTFEVVNKQQLSVATEKTAQLVARGVLRAFALDVRRVRALAWSTETHGWSVLANDAFIEDDAFVAPLPVAALVSAATADDAVATALLAKQNPVLMRAHAEAAARAEAKGRAEGEAKGRAEGEAKGRAEGEAKGRAEAVLALLASRGVAVDAKARARILRCDDAQEVSAWFQRALTATSVAAVLGRKPR